MQQIPLQAVPTQSFSVILDGNQWDWRIELVNDAIAVSILRNGTLIINGLNIVGGMRIIPSEYEEAGNFVLVTMNQQIPDYTKFGTGQQLIYLSAEELSAIRVPPPPVLTTIYFDPNAALPLRIFPQGYVQVFSYQVENPNSYAAENATDEYVTETGADQYATETNPVYITEDGTGFYFTEGS